MSIVTVRMSPVLAARGSRKKLREPGRQSEFTPRGSGRGGGWGTNTGAPAAMFGGTAIGLSGGAWPIWADLAQAANTTQMQTITAMRVIGRSIEFVPFTAAAARPRFRTLKERRAIPL